MSLNSGHVAVLGGGSFGTVLAHLSAANGHATRLWVRREDQAREINQTHCNSRYLPDLELHPTLVAETQLQKVLSEAQLVLVSVPSGSVLQVLRDCAPFVQSHQFWVSTTKGIDARGFTLMSSLLTQELPSVQVGVLSGPNLAKELARGVLTATVIASPHPDLREAVQQVLSSACLRVYANTDMQGVELAGALKNIYAIISGMASALNLGENTRAMLMTRSLAEMSRFAVAMGANPMTFMGLAGVGDLIVTCSSPLSRNFRVGHALASGRRLEEVIAELGEVAEGVNTIRLVHFRAAELGIEMPLAEGVYRILHEQVPVPEVIAQLMSRSQTSDVEFILPRAETHA